MYRFAIDNQEELKEGIIRVLSEQCAYISDQTAIPENIDRSVHEMRKALKRIRAVLRLVRWDIGEELFNRENLRFRSLSRQLSDLRDYHVMISYLADNFSSEELKISEDGYISLINYLNVVKEDELKRLIDNQTLENINEQVQMATVDFNNYPLHSLGPHTIRQGVTKIYSQCLKKMEQTQLMLDDLPLHELRKRVKYLLNQMTLMQEVWPDYFITYSTSLKRASDLLGDDHNLAEIIIIVSALREKVLNQEDRTRLIGDLKVQREQIHRELWPLLGKLFTEDADAFVNRITSYWLISRE